MMNKNIPSPDLVPELGVSKTTEFILYSHPLYLIHLGLLTNPSPGIGSLCEQLLINVFRVPDSAVPITSLSASKQSEINM
jgi:hypothetical protein